MMRVAWASLALALAACGFQHGAATEQHAGVDDAGRDDGAIDDAPADATRTDGDRCDPATCGTAGGACMNGVCRIDPPADDSPVACPSDCAVGCSRNDHSCQQGMSCPAEASCGYACSGDHTCDSNSTLSCAPGSTCEVFCKGGHACIDLTIDCQPGATCTYHCCSGMSCSGTFACNGAGCIEGPPVCPL